MKIDEMINIVLKEAIEDKKFNDELKQGIKVESEHTDVYNELEKWLKENFKDFKKMPWTKEEFFEKIAKAHLKELPDYYTRLSKMESEK